MRKQYENNFIKKGTKPLRDEQTFTK